MIFYKNKISPNIFEALYKHSLFFPFFFDFKAQYLRRQGIRAIIKGYNNKDKT